MSKKALYLAFLAVCIGKAFRGSCIMAVKGYSGQFRAILMTLLRHKGAEN